MSMAQIADSRNHDIFSSVFPPQNHFVPTPQVTPDIGTLSPGQPFGGFNTINSAVSQTLQLNTAWSAVTSWLKKQLLRGPQIFDQDQAEAWQLLLQSHATTNRLIDWYAQEVANQFVLIEQYYEVLCEYWPQAIDDTYARQQVWQALEHLSQCALQSHDFTAVWTHREVERSIKQAFHRLADAIRAKWIALVNGLSFRARLQESLAAAFFTTLRASSIHNARPDCWQSARCECKVDFNDMPLEQLSTIGMGGLMAERALAQAAHKFLVGHALEKRCFQVDWRGEGSCAERLRLWVDSVIEPLISSAVMLLNDDPRESQLAPSQALLDVAMKSLGQNRTNALFEYINVWPQSAGAVDDIKAYISWGRSGDKAHVCEACQRQVQQRLLHAGASTSEILGFYINLISVFKRLDPRGVMLEKVSPTIRQYLRLRNDAMVVIAESLLSDKDSSADNIGICRPLVHELEHAIHSSKQQTQSLGWDDMQWMPEPIDATPQHRSNAADDALSCILSLFEQDELVKEVETVLAERLLRSSDQEIVKETRLLELLKSRLDASKLQNAEVMLKDIRDSVLFERRLRPDTTPAAEPTPKEIQAAIPSEGITIGELYSRFERRIRRTQFQAIVKVIATRRSDLLFPKRMRQQRGGEAPPQSEPARQDGLQLRILSSSAWPQMQSSGFAIPEAFATQLQHAEERFSNTSGQRKLHWRPALGRMSVTLELEDRTIEEHDIPAWRAMVINAFADTTESQTIEQLASILSMEETLVKEAIAHWLGKRVLYQESSGHFAVLERLDMEVEDEQMSAAPAEAFSGLKSQDAVLRENAVMFEAFIANMLQNGGAKEIGGMMGITNMMKMVLPTFTYGDDEVKWLLAQMASKGTVTNNGDLWSIAG